MMKILHLQLLPLLSGVQRVSVNEILKLNNQYDYTLLCSYKGPLTDLLEKNNVKTSTISTLVRNISPINDVKSLFSIMTFLKSERFDIIHTHSSKTGLLGRVAAKIVGVKKVIHTVHGFAFPSARNKLQFFIYFVIEYFARYFTDYLIVLNNSDYQYAINKLRYQPSKVFLIPNGVDTEFFKPVSKNNDFLTFSMVGRLWEQKDPMTLVRAINNLPLAIRSQVRVNIAGDGELYAEINQYITTNNLEDTIKLSGWLSNVKTLLDQTDVFILPSKWEGMPLAILEAMASGLPCIVTDIPGNNDLVKDGINGFLFSTGDYIALSKHIEKLVNSPDLRDLFSIKNRELTVKKFSLASRNKSIVELYLR